MVSSSSFRIYLYFFILQLLQFTSDRPVPLSSVRQIITVCVAVDGSVDVTGGTGSWQWLMVAPVATVANFPSDSCGSFIQILCWFCALTIIAGSNRDVTGGGRWVLRVTVAFIWPIVNVIEGTDGSKDITSGKGSLRTVVLVSSVSSVSPVAPVASVSSVAPVTTSLWTVALIAISVQVLQSLDICIH